MSPPITRNTLYYGDNLQILREHIDPETVDLVYLDPPFNSNRSYNVLYKDESGKSSDAQITAFDDTWHWGPQAEQLYSHITLDINREVGQMIGALRKAIGVNQMMAYLVMMAARLVELHRVLKPTGSLYLHCDPTASHYLKVVMDTIFEPQNFRNEITWLRHNARSTTGKWPRIHDTLLFYSRGSDFLFQPVQVKASQTKIPHTLILRPDGRKYQTYELTAPGVTRDGESGRPWRGFDPSKMGRHWANTQSVMDAWDNQGFIHWPKNKGFPRRLAEKPFEAEERTVTVGDVWTDIDRINQAAAERLGYPTQKPLALLERIIEASSNPGDLVLDPFCGCGTTIAAAQKLGRRWIGIDITHLALNPQKYRLRNSFGLEAKRDYDVVGEPLDIGAARQLAGDDPFQFQAWAVSLVGGISLAGSSPHTARKGADRGVDGVINFLDRKSAVYRAIVQVKTGKVGSKDIRDLLGTIASEDAALGVFVTLQPPTRDMQTAAAAAGIYTPTWWQGSCPRIQIITIEQLLAGAKVQMPPAKDPYPTAPRIQPIDPDAPTQQSLFPG